VGRGADRPEGGSPCGARDHREGRSHGGPRSLGAARAGDIGKLFPDTDPAYEGADSLKLLAAVAGHVRDLGFTIVDVDSVVAAQAPKLSPHREAMRANLAAAMGVPVESVGVKATTTEHLGFEGRGEGISAYATCLLTRL